MIFSIRAHVTAIYVVGKLKRDRTHAKWAKMYKANGNIGFHLLQHGNVISSMHYLFSEYKVVISYQA